MGETFGDLGLPASTTEPQVEVLGEIHVAKRPWLRFTTTMSSTAPCWTNQATRSSAVRPTAATSTSTAFLALR